MAAVLKLLPRLRLLRQQEQLIPWGKDVYDELTRLRSEIDAALSAVSIGPPGPPGPPGPSYTDEQAQDAVAAALMAGSGISIVYNDSLNQISITATGGMSAVPLFATRESFSGVAAAATLSTTPISMSERVVVDTNPQRRVASAPGLNEYSISGNVVTFGGGLAAGEVATINYWTLLAQARKEEFTTPGSTLTLTSTPFTDSEVVVIGTVEQRRVASSPGLNEYTLSGGTITLGSTLVSGEVAWVTYWTASPSATPRHDDFSGPASSLPLTASPVMDSEIIVISTRHQRRVVSSPGLNEYTLSGSMATLGSPLVAGEVAWVDYFS